MQMRKYVTVVLLSVLLSGCAHPIASDLRTQAKPLTYIQAAANPKSTRGTLVIWGGRIIDAVNTTNGGQLYVLQLPLNRRGRPTDNDTLSGGRFIVTTPKALDSGTYQRGRLVTVAGVMDGVRNERLQNVLYRYPVLDLKQDHLWSSAPRDFSSSYYGESQ